MTTRREGKVRHGTPRTTAASGSVRAQVRGVEVMEPRLLLSVQPVVVGSVYVEEDFGSDLHGDSFYLTFNGGAPGTQLTSIEISGDQDQVGFSLGDVFFDVSSEPTASGSGRYGADDAFAFKVLSQSGIDVVRSIVPDGSTTLRLEFSGFDPGEVLVFSIDVDEVEDFDPNETDIKRINEGFDPITSGVEFQGSGFTAVFTAPNFAEAAAESTFVNRYDPNLSDTGLSLPADDADGKRDRSAGAVATRTQQAIPATLSGHVYHDLNLNGRRDASEPGLAGVVIRAVPLETVVDQTIATATSDASGRYQFAGLMPGRYQLVESQQPSGYLDWLDRPGTVDGRPVGAAVNPGDLIDDIVLAGGSEGIDYDFAEILPVSIRGRVHLATPDGDCFSDDVVHEPVVGAVVRLLNEQGQVVAETKTDADGRYQFTDLAPGVYTVREETPAGLFEGGARTGSVNGRSRGVVIGPNEVGQLDLTSGENVQQVDFCEQEPVSIRGRVHLATPDGDCFSDEFAHEPLVGVTIRLLDESGAQVAETVTDAQGRYEFFGLKPGVYSLVEVTPPGLMEGGAQVGTIDGQLDVTAEVVDANTITHITLGPGQAAEEFEFCEFAPARIAGSVYHDQDNDGRRDSGERGIDQVLVRLVDVDGQVVATQITDGTGAYAFGDVQAGTYTVVETHPSGWMDGLDTAGTVDGLTVGHAINPGDRIEQITVGWGQAGADYDFGELLPTSILGDVHLSTVDGDCFSIDRDHAPLSDVVVQLLDAQGNVIAETRTDTQGHYAFVELPPGSYAVRELTPQDLIDGGAQAGTLNGTRVGRVVGSSEVVDITLQSGDQVQDVDFCEHRPSELSGYVYHDLDNNGIRSSAETGIAQTVVVLYDLVGNEVARTATDVTGFYVFDRLPAGQYRLVEQQPVDWLDGLDVAGTIDGVPLGQAVNPGDEIGSIQFGWGQAGREYNFGELLPASLLGIVHTDLNDDCLLQDDEQPLEGIEIQLFDARGQQIGTQRTDALGRFAFTNLQPGTYTLREVQPRDYFTGGQLAGTGGGDASWDNEIRAITVRSGDHWVDYRFCDEPASEISGHVFQDGATISLGRDERLPDDLTEIRDGVLTADDRRLPGVVLELRNGVFGTPVTHESALPAAYEPGPIRVTTDANGYYRFAGLRKGNYAIYELQPDGYLDSIDTSGSIPAIAINRHDYDEIAPQVVAALSQDPNFDAIVRIALPPGEQSLDNNFSEIAVQNNPLILITPPKPAPIRPLAANDWVTPPLARNPGVEPLDYRPTPYGRFRAVLANTWHLSVLDGGLPRGDGLLLANRGPFWFTPNDEYYVGWQNPAAHQLNWVLIVDGKLYRERIFGSRDGTPVAGDFNGDGLDEIGIFHDGQWLIDINGDGDWGSSDLWVKLGHQDDQPVVGDWNGDGKDDVGIFGRAWPGDRRAILREPGLPDLENRTQGEAKNLPPKPTEAAQGTRDLRLTAEGDTRSDVIDHVFHYGTTGDRAVTGDWNGDGIANIGVFYKGLWHLDRNGDGQFLDADDQEVEFGQDGDLPIVGDFNGDGVDEIGILSNGRLVLDINRNFRVDEGDQVIPVPEPHARPVVGDWNGDGIDDVGLVYDNMRFVEIDARKP